MGFGQQNTYIGAESVYFFGSCRIVNSSDAAPGIQKAEVSTVGVSAIGEAV
jgi:hypothetical protein